MANGMEWALQAIMKSLNLDPEKVKGSFDTLGQIIVDAGDRLKRIEAQNLAIMRHFEIPQPEQTNGTGNSVERIATADADDTSAGTTTRTEFQ